MTNVTFRIEQDLKDSFYKKCEDNLQTPSVVLRELIRRFTEDKKEG